MKNPHFPAVFILFAVHFLATFSTEFAFNGFDMPDLLFYGDSFLELRFIMITNDSTFSIGRALYKSPVQTMNGTRLLPFSTSFIFSIAPCRNFSPGHGFAFLFVPITGTQGATGAQNLGLFSRTANGRPENHVLAVEFDVFKNQEFSDIDANHVGININSLTSVSPHPAGFWTDSGDFIKTKLNNGVNYQVWIDFSGDPEISDLPRLNVTMSRAGVKKPSKPLISIPLDLSEVFKEEMYVGFCAATGSLVESHRILAWSFSNSNFSASEALVTSKLPSFEVNGKSVLRSTAFIAGISVAVIAAVAALASAASYLYWIKKRQHRCRESEQIEDWELEFWPHRIPYHEIHKATQGFSESNLVGIGGNGKVYKGTLNRAVIAVKCIAKETQEGMREFVAEISTIGRLKHRNLVGLRGWCKKENGLLLIYDFMENGSLDKRIFEPKNEDKELSWETRIRVLKDVCAGLLYLHEGWEARVLHRDIKASNVLLDGQMRARLGDFGLAKLYGHGQPATTTRVVGTVGYMAPEIIRNGRASVETDVFGFGVLVLEVVCGRRPVEDGKPGLTEWIWDLMGKGELVEALDPRVRRKGGWDIGEVEKALKLGLLCTYPDSNMRPSMRLALRVLEGEGVELEESEGEGMEVYLLKKSSKSVWAKYRASASGGPHPTFQGLVQSLPSSISISDSDIIVTGR